MDTRNLSGAVLDPLAIPIDRLYRISPDVYQGMIEHGLLTGRDQVVFRDGLLVVATAGNGDSDPTDPLYRMPLGVYDGVADAGLLGPSDKVELLDGLLVKKMTKGDPHIAVTMLIQEALRGVVPAGWHVKKEDPVALPTGPKGHASEPEPDVSVVRGGIRDYLTHKPRPEDAALVIEVSDRSLRDDRAKLIRYAWAGIPVAWLVNLNDRTVEVHSGPSGAAGYRDVEVYGEGEEIAVVVDGREVGRIAARDILP
jgi:Uma2 family endonuclease